MWLVEVIEKLPQIRSRKFDHSFVGISSIKSYRFTIGSIKITPGVTELSRVRVPIDLVACFLDVGSSYPGSAHWLFRSGMSCLTPKGGAVRPLKGNVSWV